MIEFTDYYLLDKYYENGQFAYAFDPKALESINTVENPYAEISKSIYRSNVVEFWLPLTDNEVEGIDTNRYWISSFGIFGIMNLEDLFLLCVLKEISFINK